MVQLGLTFGPTTRRRRAKSQPHRKSVRRTFERRSTDGPDDERLEALQDAAKRAELLNAKPPRVRQPLVGARAYAPDQVEYEVVPLPASSAYLGSSLKNGV